MKSKTSDEKKLSAMPEKKVQDKPKASTSNDVAPPRAKVGKVPQDDKPTKSSKDELKASTSDHVDIEPKSSLDKSKETLPPKATAVDVMQDKTTVPPRAEAVNVPQDDKQTKSSLDKAEATVSSKASKLDDAANETRSHSAKSKSEKVLQDDETKRVVAKKEPDESSAATSDDADIEPRAKASTPKEQLKSKPVDENELGGMPEKLQAQSKASTSDDSANASTIQKKPIGIGRCLGLRIDKTNI